MALFVSLSWNLQRLSGADFVRVAQHVAISLENLHVVVGVAIQRFADLGETIARLYGVRALLSSRNAGALRLGGFSVRVDTDVGRQLLGPIRVYLLDLIPNLVFGLRGGSSPLEEQLVVLDVNVTEPDLLLLDRRQDRGVFLLHLFQLIITCHLQSSSKNIFARRRRASGFCCWAQTFFRFRQRHRELDEFPFPRIQIP